MLGLLVEATRGDTVLDSLPLSAPVLSTAHSGIELVGVSGGVLAVLTFRLNGTIVVKTFFSPLTVTLASTHTSRRLIGVTVPARTPESFNACITASEICSARSHASRSATGEG